LGQQAGLSVQREPQNLLQDGTGDKPAAVLFGSFYHGRDLCVDVTIVNPFTDIHKKLRDPDSFLQSAVTHKPQHYAARYNAAGKLFAVCAFEVSGGIYLSEMNPFSSGFIVVFLKDRLFLWSHLIVLLIPSRIVNATNHAVIDHFSEQSYHCFVPSLEAMIQLSVQAFTPFHQ
jgi:hypothetical protein